MLDVTLVMGVSMCLCSQTLTDSLSLELQYAVWISNIISRWWSENFSEYIGHITVSPISSNKWLLIVDREFFLSLSCQYTGNLFQRITPTFRRSSEWIVSSSICVSFKHDVGTEGIVKKQPGNACSSHGAKAIIKNRGCHTIPFVTVTSHSVTFGAVTRIRPK